MTTSLATNPACDDYAEFSPVDQTIRSVYFAGEWTKCTPAMAIVTKSVAEQMIGDRGWLALLPPEFRAEVLRRSKLTHFPPNEVVFRTGDPLGGIYGLASGAVRIDTAPPGKTPRLVCLGLEGYWTGEGCFLTRKPRRAELRTIDETTLLHLPLDAMDELAKRFPETTRYVSLILMMSAELLLQVVNDLQRRRADRRIASVLQRAACNEAKQILLTQTEIGVMANASRKQVNATLQRFADEGWLTSTYRSVSIKDVEALRHFAEGDGGE